MLLMTIGRGCFSFKGILLGGGIVALVWEYFAPVIKPGAVSDPFDILCYLVGSAGYYMIIKIVGCAKLKGGKE